VIEASEVRISARRWGKISTGTKGPQSAWAEGNVRIKIVKEHPAADSETKKTSEQKTGNTAGKSSGIGRFGRGKK
jgi:hypothetical protein